MSLPKGWSKSNKAQMDTLECVLMAASCAGEKRGVKAVAVVIVLGEDYITSGFSGSAEDPSAIPFLLEHGPNVLKMVIERATTGQNKTIFVEVPTEEPLQEE